MKKNILVIDDSVQAQQMITAALVEQGYAVTASSGFAEASGKAQTVKPDLVLIDVVMPELNGFETCRKIKSLFQKDAPPIIMMTGKLDAVDPVLARKMGANDFVVKTSDMNAVVQAVQKIFLVKENA